MQINGDDHSTIPAIAPSPALLQDALEYVEH